MEAHLEAENPNFNAPLKKEEATRSAPRGIFSRVPRIVWLALSAALLLIASLTWYLRLRSWDTRELSATGHALLSPGWWDEPVVRNADAALPEISGKIFGIAIQNSGGRRRVWIVGPAGFLAYSDDDGRCWTRYEYDKNAGEFYDSKLSSCNGRTTAAMRWPELLLTAQAASSEIQEKQANPPPNVRNQSAEPNTASPAADSPSQTQPSSSTPPWAQEAPRDSKQQSPVQQGPPPSELPQAVETKQQAPVETKQKEAAGAGPTGSKEPAASKPPAKKPARAKISPAKTTSSGPPQAPQQGPTPPAQPPDLLLIGFDSRPLILSTGGRVWELTPQSRWRMTNIRETQFWDAGAHRFSVRVRPGVNGGAETWDERPDSLEISPQGSAASWLAERAGAGSRLIRREKGAADAPLYQCSDCRFSSIAFDDNGSNAWVSGWTIDSAGTHGLVLRSGDKGSTWQPVTRGALPPERRTAAAQGRVWMWPPRWYLLVLLLSVALAAPALRTPQLGSSSRADNPDEPVSDASVEQCLTSDRPLAPGDVDALGLSDIALGLSSFLRNEKTLPPLTIAVTGEWGSGKSSLMNLLYCDLQSWGMRPVWFNAWHHQKEEHLLAALLQTIRLEAVPSVWSLRGVPFRLNLARQRIWRKLPMVVLLAAVTIFLFVLDWHLRTQHHTDLFMWVVKQFLPSATPNAEPATTAPIYGGLIAVIATVTAVWKGLTAFGANPAALLASVAQGNRIKDLEAQTSFRQKFAVEFREVTRALGPKRPLVIFIDDLDRCLPGNVRDVLEAINFLVSSGECFVVIGMDRIQVQRAVGLSFKEVAEEASRAPGQHAPGAELSEAALAEAAREKRADFAAKYLEKLVNLEIRVPVAGDDNIRQKLFRRPAEPAAETAKVRALRGSIRLARFAIPTALSLILLVLSWQLSLRLALPLWYWMDQQSTSPQAQQPTAPASPGPAIAGASGAGKTAAAAKEIGTKGAGEPQKTTPATPGSSTKAAGVLVSQEAGPAPSLLPAGTIWPTPGVLWLPFLGVAFFVLLAAYIVLTTRPGIVTRDSQEFTDALEQVWYPLVLARQNTPRSAKRFINRVRYLAMRQRRQNEKVPWWELVMFPKRLPEVTRSESWQYIPEPLLVALAAIEALEPQWIYNPNNFKLVSSTDGLPNGEARADSIPGAAELFQEARARHAKVFEKEVAGRPDARWSAVARYRDTFVTIWPRVFNENQ